MIRLTLVRHGHTAWNEAGRYQGHAPIPLSERGLAQAQHLAAALAQDDSISAIYSSDLLRCRQTVGPLASQTGLTPVFDARWRETNYGTWQGLTRKELAELDAEHFTAYQQDPFTVQVPGGESQQMLAERVLPALAAVLAAHPGEHIVIVTHGGPIREVLRHYSLWQGGLPASNASRTVLEVSEGNHTARENIRSDISHLPEALRPDESGTQFLVQR